MSLLHNALLFEIFFYFLNKLGSKIQWSSIEIVPTVGTSVSSALSHVISQDNLLDSKSYHLCVVFYGYPFYLQFINIIFPSKSLFVMFKHRRRQMPAHGIKIEQICSEVTKLVSFTQSLIFMTSIP